MLNDELSPVTSGSGFGKSYFNTRPAVRVYDCSPDEPKITLESYLAAGRPLHTKTGLLYGSDALDYILGKENQSDEVKIAE